ncbi:2-keto-4-pentenoate hydratase [Burkholderia contaminans]|uniref:2-keto-4-pentenoate hydratase n=1 Tax=Burkholderia contaminans TaxID=488447 RepID=UPI000F5B09E6|nr:2-keto-4-pentenoate hydratase [Burkholderia contaminans]MCA8157922.1 2-keto-4-pentenoate hydratase [Burkholderia contaminans]RQT01736.1 2-keto-4-pentenoate hydratase [Burkholderia contaminans]VWD60345.1 2-keto-4-pentenoate hydratase [Burkholderia contaminans]
MTPQQREEAARALYRAAQNGTFIPPLRETYPDMSAEDAYAIQSINTDRRISEGRRVVGRKVGLTSPVVQRQLGVDQPDFGSLFDDLSFGDAEIVPLSILHQPKVEAEIGFVLGRDLNMECPTHQEVLQAVDYLIPALEIVGSRIDSWNIKFVDTVADNASSGVYVLGSTPISPSGLDLSLAGMCLSRRGEPVSTGAGAACLGNPLNAVVWLARTMMRLGKPLRAGELVLSGALGPMVAVNPGDVFECSINGLGTVRTEFESDNQGAGVTA